MNNRKEVFRMIKKLTEDILAGRRLKRGEDVSFLLNENLEVLCHCADKIKQHFCGNQVGLCTIVNGRSGRCSEDCKYCAQSAHHFTGLKEHGFRDADTLVQDCKKKAQAGIHRYCIVTSGRTLEGADLKTALIAYKKIKESCDISFCASHGFLSEDTLLALKEVGVTRCHANIETSRHNFPNICTTHTYDDKIHYIKTIQKVGLSVCSGGIIGMGETWDDRIDMAVSLAELGVDSIPINVLIPIPGTPFQNLPRLPEADILRTIAIFRFFHPTAEIRLAAGRSLMVGSGEKAFFSGANATITGNLLTTSGNNMKEDIEMLTAAGFDLK